MERCHLQLTIQPQALTSTSKPFTLEVFRLNSTLPLDTRALTYDSRPPRVSKVAAVEVSNAVDTHWSRSFACASDEILTFELACLPTLDDGDCRVEWWQNKSNPLTGMHQPNRNVSWTEVRVLYSDLYYAACYSMMVSTH